MTDESLIILPRAYQAGAILGHRPSAYDATKVIPIEIPFTRNSVAMRRNKAGLWESVANNVPRLHYPIGGGCPSWLFEAAATNTCRFSTDFSNAVWAAIGTATKAPSALPTNIVGVTPYDIAGLGTAGVNFFYQSLSGNTDVIYQCFIRATDAGDVGKTIRLTSNGGMSVNIILTLDWQEFSVFASGAAHNQFMLSSGNTGTPATKCTISYCGIINSPSPSSPIITTASAVTRLKDDPTLTNASSIIGQIEGCIFLDINFIADSTQASFRISDGTNFIYIQKYSNNRFYVGVYDGSYVGSITSGVLATGRLKIAFGYILNSLVLYINGSLVGTDLSSTIPACDRIFLYTDASGAFQYNEVKLFKYKPSNLELAALTT